MTPKGPPGDPPPDSSGGIDRKVGEYVDRINSGSSIDPIEVLAENPIDGPEILERLERFIDSFAVARTPDPLGTLGDYTLRRQIGRGGMGVVYDAWQNSLDRQVALKVLPAGIAADDRAFQRFMREAKTAAKLQHPHIVGVYGMGLEQNTPYFAMEFVEGETLAQVLIRLKDSAFDAQTPFGKKDDVRYFANLAEAFASVADGLQHAHSKGIIHRDIKPSNLILDLEGRLRILDFGLARLEGQESLTLTGDFLGTPLYMSPEQARRKKIPVDHRTDIYSLGTTLYEMLALRPPFQGKDHNDTLSQIIERDPIEPRKLNSRIPRDLETIVLKCLRKEPADRYGTAEALAQDLRRFIRSDPVEARAQPRWERWWELARRNRFRIMLVGSLAGLLLVGAALGILLWREEKRARWAEYVTAVNRALVDLELGLMNAPGNLMDGETVSLGLLFPEDVEDHEHSLLDETLAHLDRALTLFPDGVEVHLVRFRILRALGEIDAASEELDRIVAVNPHFIPATLYCLADLRFRGQRERMNLVRKDMEERTSSGWQRLWLDAHHSAVQSEWKQLDEIYTRLLDSSANEPFVGFETELRLKRGRASLRRGDHLRAVEDFVHLRDASESLGPVLLLASSYYLMGSRESARRTLDHALSAHATTPAALALCGLCDRFGDQEEARTVVESIEDDRVRYAALQKLYWRSNRLEDALDAGKKAIALGEGCWSVHASQTALYLELQRPAEARSSAKEAISMFPGNKRLLVHMGWVYRSTSEIDKSIEAFKQGLPIPIAYEGLSWCYWDLGDLESSDRCLQEALIPYPRFTAAYWGLTRNCQFRGDLEGAIANEAQCNFLAPGWATEILLNSYSPERSVLYAPYWENLSLALESAVECNQPDHHFLGLSALCNLHRREAHLTRALDHASQAVEKTRRLDGLFLAILAEIQAAQGKTEEAIRSLERAAEVYDRRSFGVELLKAYRRQIYPRVASMASVDALLEGKEDFQMAAEELQRSSPEQAAYLKASLNSADDPEEAEKVLEGLLQQGQDEEALILRLAKLRRDLGRREGALELIEDRLLNTEEATAKPWAVWLEIASSSPPLLIDDLMVRRPLIEAVHADSPDTAGPRLAGDLRWLLRELAAMGEARISCGRATDYMDRQGRTWSRDRFFDGGANWSVSAPSIQNSEDPELYHVMRYWDASQNSYLAPGYRILIPNGHYELVLHFCKILAVPSDPARRPFDIVIEGEHRLEAYDPAGGIVGVVEKKTFAVEVNDGCLDLVVASSSPWAAFVSAIEVRLLP
jgi:serine/threonine protein kinase/Tfp pilus assembly protein PilF